MLHRRLYNSNNNTSNTERLLFYAPLTKDKNPTVVWDGNEGVHTAGNGVIQKDELYIANGTTGYGLMWNCRPPMGKNLTFNMWVKPNTYSSGINNMHGWRDLGYARYTGCSFAKHQNHNYNSFFPEWIDFYNSTIGLIAPANTYTFISWTIKFNLPNVTFIIYANGVRKGEWDFTNSNFFGVTSNSRFTIGSTYSSNNCPGYFKQFSCYEEMTDEQVKKLYENGGTPK